MAANFYTAKRSTTQRAQDAHTELNLDIALLNRRLWKLQMDERAGNFRKCPELLKAERARLNTELRFIKWRFQTLQNGSKK